LKVLELEPTKKKRKRAFKIEELLKSDKKIFINCESMSLHASLPLVPPENITLTKIVVNTS
jgi:hypothetical protein